MHSHEGSLTGRNTLRILEWLKEKFLQWLTVFAKNPDRGPLVCVTLGAISSSHSLSRVFASQKGRKFDGLIDWSAWPVELHPILLWHFQPIGLMAIPIGLFYCIF